MADPTLIENPEEEVVQTDVQNQEIIENAQETGEIDFSAAPEENLQGINKVIEDGGIAVRDFIDNTLLARDARALRKYINEIQPGIDMETEVEFKDGYIEEDVELPINLSFFWPDAEL